MIQFLKKDKVLVKNIIIGSDHGGFRLKTEIVEDGKSAVAPTAPTRDGYKFTGWDKTFSNITSDLTVTAQYAEMVYTPIRVKENNSWTPIVAIYKKINGVWVIQSDFETLFSNQNIKYQKM